MVLVCNAGIWVVEFVDGDGDPQGFPLQTFTELLLNSIMEKRLQWYGHAMGREEGQKRVGKREKQKKEERHTKPFRRPRMMEKAREEQVVVSLPVSLSTS